MEKYKQLGLRWIVKVPQAKISLFTRRIILRKGFSIRSYHEMGHDGAESYG
jgi:hypothetical protein